MDLDSPATLIFVLGLVLCGFAVAHLSARWGRVAEARALLRHRKSGGLTEGQPIVVQGTLRAPDEGIRTCFSSASMLGGATSASPACVVELQGTSPMRVYLDESVQVLLGSRETRAHDGRTCAVFDGDPVTAAGTLARTAAFADASDGLPGGVYRESFAAFRLVPDASGAPPVLLARTRPKTVYALAMLHAVAGVTLVFMGATNIPDLPRLRRPVTTRVVRPLEQELRMVRPISTAQPRTFEKRSGPLP